ncbi:hypothetical protein FKG94_14225 [Exilibacterium tricleocarpae]|uniref:Uncharacterized protein n=1 Tax=Exilibacterium tricleocarpae TaxID=2591008 RepID=A0A545TM51_9GAMM|nr:hypothetical protein [Exilibacterium tricleocarpae]TQV78221.1 hypothetical protein FKG94_14225 [Exilibacterium tricleocarpae]
MRVTTGIAITISVTIGFGLGHYLAGRGSSDKQFFTEPPAVADTWSQAPIDTPKAAALSADEVEASREQHFTDIDSIREVLLIPTDFGQTEALYALAGRADIGRLQELIGEAGRIDIPGEREAALHILFSRYADIDARAALVYLDSLNLDIATGIIRSIFRSWAKVDVDTAIATANQISNARHRRTAAEAIVRTFSDHWPELLDQVTGRLLDPIDTNRFEIERMIRLAATNPSGALAEALALGDDQARQQAVYGIALNMAKHNPQQALAAVGQMVDQTMQKQLNQAIMQEWARNDAEAAMAYITNQGLTDQTNLVTVALQNMAHKDPLAALNQASQLDPRTRQVVYSGIYATWGQQDVRAAIAHAEALGDPQLTRQVYANLGRIYAGQYPDEALLWAEQLEGPAKASVVSSVLQEMANSDPRLALDAALTTDATPSRNNTISHILQTIARDDPQSAVAYLDQLPAGNLRDRSVQNILQSWAGSDPEAAYTWVEQQEGQAYTKTVLNLANQLAATDPEKAAQLTDRIRQEARPQWLQTVAGGMARRDQQGAVEWLQQYQQEPGYSQALASITQVTAQTDPLAALRMAENITSSSDKRNAIDSITHSWSSRDPTEAARWASNIKDSAQRASAIQIAAGQWARYDPDAASSWVLGLNDTEARDRALVNLVNRHGSSADFALPLANAIKSDQQRVQAVTSMALNLARYDRAKAERMVDQANIDAEARAQIKQHLARNRR